MPGLNIPGTYPPDAYLSDAISAEAASFISDRAAAGEPFFVYMPHYVVHTPIEAPAPLVAYYQNKINSLAPGAVNGHADAEYAAMVQKMDESLGRILAALDDPDGDPGTDDSVRDETIVIFTADNGGLTNFNITSNRPYREGKGSVHGGGIREPLIVSYTGNASVTQGSNGPTRSQSRTICTRRFSIGPVSRATPSRTRRWTG
jgi:arylsulfatase A